MLTVNDFLVKAAALVLEVSVSSVFWSVVGKQLLIMMAKNFVNDGCK